MLAELLQNVYKHAPHTSQLCRFITPKSVVVFFNIHTFFLNGSQMVLAVNSCTLPEHNSTVNYQFCRRDIFAIELKGLQPDTVRLKLFNSD